MILQDLIKTEKEGVVVQCYSEEDFYEFMHFIRSTGIPIENDTHFKYGTNDETYSSVFLNLRNGKENVSAYIEGNHIERFDDLNHSFHSSYHLLKYHEAKYEFSFDINKCEELLDKLAIKLK